MKDLPIAARLYVGAVLAAGAVVLALFAPHTIANPVVFVTLLVCSSLASVLKVTLPLASSSSTMSVSYAVDFAALLLLGANETMLVAAVSTWAQCTFRTQVRSTPHRTLFSMASLVLTVKAAGVAYTWLGGPPPGQSFTMLTIAKPLVAAATTYFICNTLLIATAISLSTQQPIPRVWNQNFLWSAPSYFFGAGAAAVAAAVIERGGYWMALLTAAPVYLIYRTYKVYMGRIQDQQRHVQQVSDLHLATIEALALAIDAKDQTAQSHIRRVQVYAAGLARALGMPENEIQGVKTAALLHDIGKLAVPEHILSKPGPLTQAEFQKIRIHPQVGAEIISGVPSPYPVAPLILSHHERWGGNGHPAGLQGEEVSLGARILSVVDYSDALMSERLYHKAMSLAAAPGSRQGSRPARGTDLHRHVSVANCGSRSDAEAGEAVDADRGRSAAGAAGGRSGERCPGAHECLPGHRPRPPRNLRALRNRPGDGQQPWRLGHDGADLVEIEQHRPVLVLRALSLQRRNRNAALPLRHRRGSGFDPAAHDSQRPRPDRLGRAQPPAAGQRAAERRLRGRRDAVGPHDAPLGAGLPAGVQRALHRDDVRLSHRAGRLHRRSSPAARSHFRAGRGGHLQLDRVRADAGRFVDRSVDGAAEHALHVHAPDA